MYITLSHDIMAKITSLEQRSQCQQNTPPNTSYFSNGSLFLHFPTLLSLDSFAYICWFLFSMVFPAYLRDVCSMLCFSAVDIVFHTYTNRATWENTFHCSTGTLLWQSLQLFCLVFVYRFVYSGLLFFSVVCFSPMPFHVFWEFAYFSFLSFLVSFKFLWHLPALKEDH